MSADQLRAALGSQGIECDVEAHGRLAVVVAGEAAAEWSTPALRAMVVELAADAGFTHVALEIADRRAGAALSRA